MQKSLKEKDQGFTLIELLVVIVIIGILAAIAIPIFLNQQKKGVDAGVKSDLKQLANLQESYYVDKAAYFAAADTVTNGVASGLESAADGANVKPFGDFKRSNDKSAYTVVLGASGVGGYCITGYNPDGTTSDAAGKRFYYDSVNGGLSTSNKQGGACADTL
ncbi:type IV pilin protein [Nocardioides aquiterrae]